MIMTRIRVAVILPSLGVGGTENMVANLAKYVDKSRFELLVISLADPMDTHIQRMIQDSGVAIQWCGKGRVSASVVFARVYRCLARFQPDLIHSNMYAFAFAVPYLLSHRVMLLHTIHNKPSKEFKDKYKKLIAFLYRLDRAVPVAISDIIARELVEIYPFLKNVECIYNPVETTRYLTERHLDEKKNVCFCTVARFMKQKNHTLLLHSFAKAHRKLPDISLMLVGGGELQSQLEQLSSELGISDAVKFVGEVSNVEDYLAKADVFVLSSDYEGLPLSVLEAMASGLPIISTEVGGVADIVTDNGILVKPGSCDELSTAMIELAENSERRFELGVCSRRNATQYDSAHFIAKYETLYEKYCRASRPTAD